MLSVLLVLAWAAAPTLAAAQETSPPTPPPVERPLRVFGYAGYTFSSVIRHGGTVSMLFSTARDADAWPRGIQVTTTVGQNGYVVGGGWGTCSRGDLPGCLELRGIVGRTRTATDTLTPHAWYAGAEGGVMLVGLRCSAGIAFPLADSGSRHTMFFGSIGLTLPVLGRKWAE